MRAENEHIDGLLPFYLNRTLPADEHTFVEAHLTGCPRCRAALGEWKELAAALAAPQNLPGESLPPLSPVVMASLRGKPTIGEAIQSAANLILAQKIYLSEGWLIPVVSLVLLIGVVVTLALGRDSSVWLILPLFILLPFVTALVVGFLHSLEDDPAFEIVAATPTPSSTLVFARLTLALGVVTGLALLGSVPISGFGGVPMLELVGAWLGPVLWLSALTTMLTLLWRPRTAAGVSIAIWGSIVLLLVADLNGIQARVISLEILLHPNWVVFGAQALLAGLLWLASWLWLTAGNFPSLWLERGG